MVDFLKCIICRDLFNPVTKHPKSTQCGGVCCSECVSSPCPICQDPHCSQVVDFIPLKEYVEQTIIMCVCNTRAAVFIDGKTLFPYCKLCKKSYQVGTQINDDLFKNWIDKIYAYFIREIQELKIGGFLSYMFGNIRKSSQTKLNSLRLAEQLIGNVSYCRDHIRKRAKFIDNDLEFYCICKSNLTTLTDIDACKEIIKLFLGKTGLYNEYLIRQLYHSPDFHVVRVVIEARVMNRSVMVTDICAFCRVQFYHAPAVKVSCNCTEPKSDHIICENCAMKTFSEKTKEGEERLFYKCFFANDGRFIPNDTYIKLEYSTECANCKESYIFEYLTPLDQQERVPYELICEHNICKKCSFEEKNGLIECKICRKYYIFTRNLNIKLINTLSYSKIYCSKHKLQIIKYIIIDMNLELFCEKCEDGHFGKSHSFESFNNYSKNFFINLTEFLSKENKINDSEYFYISQYNLNSEKINYISCFYKELKLGEQESLNIVDPENEINLTENYFCIKLSKSAVLFSLEFSRENIEGDLSINRYIQEKNSFEIIRNIKMSLGKDSKEFDLASIGYIPFISENYYEIHLSDCDSGYIGYKVLVGDKSSGNLEYFIGISEDSSNCTHSLITKLNFGFLF